ncbi:MAG: DNA internalization-related competence protein ComEC/Rec2, partial [Desulfuromonadaceae bacterium]
PEQRELLARGGVSHLFAISGLHLGLIFFLLYDLARQLYTRSERLLLWAPAQRVLPLLLLPALLFYLLFTGNALSTRRALLMLAVVTLLLSRARQTPPLKLWVVCALLFLLWEPLLLFQPAFQLSFAALLGILALTPRWLRKLTTRNRLWRYPATLTLTTTAATLSTFPLVLLNFHLLAPAGILTNLFAIPAIGVLALPLGLAGLLLLPVWQLGANLLLQTCAGIIHLTLFGVEQILLLPGLQGVLLYPPPQVLFALLLLCAALLLPAHDRGYQKARGMLLLAALLLVLLPSILFKKHLTVTALSVGQGDATLLSFAGGHHILIDGGGTQSKHFDIGERLLAPALGFLGVQSLDAVILSHDHPDHRQGLLYILRHFPVRAFWSATSPAKLHPELTDILRRQNIPTICPPPGWSQPDLGFAETLWLFVPDQMDVNFNNRSLVVLAGNGNDAVLLTGDLEQSGLAQLLKTPLPRSVNLLKIPHHGSRNSSPEKLLQRLTPQLVFMSLGKKNPYQFPHAEVIKALEQRQIPYWSTAADNSLKFSTNGSGWQATHWNQRLFR